MNKLIIDNRTELSDLDAIGIVAFVVQRGRISNDGKQYCYGSEILYNNNLYMVYTDLNKKSDRFIIMLWSD